MKILFLFFILLVIFFSGCDSLVQQINGESIQADSVRKARKDAIADTLPRQVRYGKIEKYGFKPDSCFGALVLGSKTSFNQFRKDNGAQFYKSGNNRNTLAYYNVGETEELEVFVTGNEKDGYVPYKLILQKAKQPNSPIFPEKHELMNKPNFISGHGIYIGMSPSYVMNVYTDQAMTQWTSRDTFCLKYAPEEKDKKYYSNYHYQSYSATYKFVDDLLRRIEYEVKPEEFETAASKNK